MMSSDDTRTSVPLGDNCSSSLPEQNAFSPVLNKRISFEHEKEYRLVHWDTALISKNIKSEKGFFIWDDNIIPDSTIDGRINVSRSIEEIEQMDIKPGLYLDCDINKLIESTFISPLAENWFIEIVNNVSKKYGLEALIKQSELNAEPLR